MNFTMKFSDFQQRNDLVAEISRLQNEANIKIDRYNATSEQLLKEAVDVVERLNKTIEAANYFIDHTADRVRDFMDKQDDEWIDTKDGEKCSEYLSNLENICISEAEFAIEIEPIEIITDNVIDGIEEFKAIGISPNG